MNRRLVKIHVGAAMFRQVDNSASIELALRTPAIFGPQETTVLHLPVWVTLEPNEPWNFSLLTLNPHIAIRRSLSASPLIFDQRNTGSDEELFVHIYNSSPKTVFIDAGTFFLLLTPFFGNSYDLVRDHNLNTTN